MSKIKYIVMDVDGTLTDGTINIGASGELFKSFYARDGLGILRAAKQGIIPIILTSRSSRIVEERAKELKIEHVLQGAGDDKAAILKEFLLQNEIDGTTVAYIGDDVNDLAAMKLCGLIGCPSDSVIEIRSVADYICQNQGGRGAVREFVDWLESNDMF